MVELTYEARAWRGGDAFVQYGRICKSLHVLQVIADGDWAPSAWP